jgi:hypothetical protein
LLHAGRSLLERTGLREKRQPSGEWTREVVANRILVDSSKLQRFICYSAGKIAVVPRMSFFHHATDSIVAVSTNCSTNAGTPAQTSEQQSAIDSSDVQLAYSTRMAREVVNR